ncbi:hypothetical protein RMSM_04614 [Rhodopirellula maiorica SM1]|uniref:Uncharacterized protein n=1 Tax=Rhodopirellula maiorica SM1 TaxID=1265738 RepID=M5RSV1_9BACT|nr:hypothetical protein RMSM_04614 [Rhodopirellula maiorica SM1]
MGFAYQFALLMRSHRVRIWPEPLPFVTVSILLTITNDDDF